MFKESAFGLPSCALVVLALILVAASPALALDPTGLVAQWSFSETSGVATADQGPNALDGELLNGAQFAGGIVGNGLHLDGVDDYVNVTAPGGAAPAPLAVPTQGTISMWFKFDRITEDGEIFPIFYLGDGVDDAGHSSVLIEVGHGNAGNTRLYFIVWADDASAGPTQCFDSGILNHLNANEWYHFAGVVAPGGNTGYLNGLELTDRHYNFADEYATDFLADVANPNVAWLGAVLNDPRGDQFFPGRIDEVLVYDRVWSASEVLDYYNATIPEPATVTFLALGAGGLFRRVRSKATAMVDGER